MDELVFGLGLWAARRFGVADSLGKLARRVGLVEVVARLAGSAGGLVASVPLLLRRSRLAGKASVLGARGARLLRLASKSGSRVLRRLPGRGAKLVGSVLAAVR